MKKLTKLGIITLLNVILLGLEANAQNTVGIGTETPNQNAVLHLTSPTNNQGLLIPSLSSEQRTAVSFMNNLSSSDNGLLVFDLDDKNFYYWHDNQWLGFGSASQLTAGNGISIINNTITNTGDIDATNEIQDLLISGNTLSISNNATASQIDLSPFTGTNTDNQTLNSTANESDRTIAISGGNEITFSVADNDNSSTNEIQDLQSVLSNGSDAGGRRITNLATPTANSDATTKLYVDSNMFSGDFSDLINIPSGLLDGDDVGIATVATNASLSGDGTATAPLSIANNAVTTTRIANSAVTNAKIADIAPDKIQASGATTGQALLWDGNSWTPQNLPASSGFNNANIIPKGNGAGMVNSQIFDNGSYIGMGRSTRIDGTSFFDFNMPITGSTYGGLSLNTTSATAKPYVGFWTAEALGAYIYFDGANNSFNIYSGSGNAFTIDNSRNIGLGTSSPSARLDVVGATELNGTLATPASGNVSVSGTSFNLSTPTRRVVRLVGSGTRPRIRTMTAGVDGQEVILINAGNIIIDISGAVNVVNSNSMVLDNLGVSLTRYSTLHLIYDNTLRAWVEISRSLNEYILN